MVPFIKKVVHKFNLHYFHYILVPFFLSHISFFICNSFCIKTPENSAIHSFGQNEAEVHPLSAEKVKAAAKAGLAAAAMKAKLFADHEEREIQRLSANIINHQVFFSSFSRVYLVTMWNFIWLIREFISVKDLKPGQKRTCPVAFTAHLCYLA